LALAIESQTGGSHFRQGMGNNRMKNENGKC
jgi:hypothetical protein